MTGIGISKKWNLPGYLRWLGGIERRLTPISEKEFQKGKRERMVRWSLYSSCRGMRCVMGAEVL